jgi:hypothetical protein
MTQHEEEGIHLHAILGKSFTPLALALIHHRVQHATLYTDDGQRAQSFREAFSKLLSSNKQGSKKQLSLKLEMIPKISEHASRSLIQSMVEFAELLVEKQETKRIGKQVLFFSGTPVHLLMLNEVVGFNSFMTLKFDNRSQQSRLYLLDESGSEGLEDIVDLSLEDILSLYGLTLEELCNRVPKIKKTRIVKSIDLHGTEICFTYPREMNFTKGRDRRKFCQFVLECEDVFGKYGIKHLTEDIMLNNWLRNTSLPISLTEVGA